MTSAVGTRERDNLGTRWGGGRSPWDVGWPKLMMWLFLISDAMTFAANRRIAADPQSGDCFANRQCRSRVDLLATKCTLAQKDCARVVKTRTAHH